MRLSQFHLRTEKETPADAEIISHQLMLRAGMLRKLAAGIYTWSPLGLRVLRKVEGVVRAEMNAAGALELQMPSIQPKELWEETGRWQKFGGQLLKIRDRKDADYCYGPTHEEVITDFARQELASYKQLPVNFYQIQTKFRDEIRPRFGVMRAREFLMKDAYSFHISDEDLAREYQSMYDTYGRIFTRLGLKFRAVFADTGAIGGSASHEFHVLADSGEDAIAFSDGSDYAANVELAEAVSLKSEPDAPALSMELVSTPGKTTIDEVSSHLDTLATHILKTLALVGEDGNFYLALLRGDHEANPIKLSKVFGLGDYRMATDEEIEEKLGCRPGYIGPVGLEKNNFDPLFGEGQFAYPEGIFVVADRAVIAMSDFVCGANQKGYHYKGVNWRRDLATPCAANVFDIRNVINGDASPNGHGTLRIARGIEVGHVFQLGRRYAEAMKCSVLDETGKAATPTMGCYGVGVSRIVAAAIEQNHDASGIIWPEAMAPWQVAVCIINPKNDANVVAAAQTLYDELNAAGVEAVLDDRGLRPGPMFADIELIGIPHRVVVSERGLAAGTFEYRARRASEAESLDRDALMQRLTASR
jgi:prolyl-tRNA synthetase